MSKRKSNNDQRTLTTNKIVAEEKISSYHPKTTLKEKNMIVPKTKEDRREKEKMKWSENLLGRFNKKNRTKTKTLKTTRIHKSHPQC